MESRVKKVVLLGEMAVRPISPLCGDLCAFLGVKPTKFDEIMRSPDPETLLYLGNFQEWQISPDSWPKADGHKIFLGLVTREFPNPKETLKYLDEGISFLISEKISFEDQREAFEDLLC